MFNRLSNLSNRAVLFILISVAIASSGLSLVVNILNNVDTSPAWWVSWLQNFSTEMFGAFLTFILLELIVSGREKRREEEREGQALKERLIREIKRGNNAQIRAAIEELNALGYLNNESLKRAYVFEGRDLQGVNFRHADLHGLSFAGSEMQKANLEYANLNSAYMEYVNLQGANLRSVKLRRADLEYANITHTHLNDADLQGALLRAAKLQGTILMEANLQNAILEDAEFDQHTILPDRSLWVPDTDMSRFTDPKHPQFWRSDNDWSPAYRGSGTS